MTTDRVFLTADEALSLLTPGDAIHCYIANGMMIGADWDRPTVEEAIRRGKCELAGGMARRMGYSIACYTNGDSESRDGLKFFATDPAKVAALEAEKAAAVAP